MIDPIAFSIGVLRSRARMERAREFRPQDVCAVGLFELTRMGDVLSALPAIKDLRRSLPEARFHLFVAAQWAALTAELMPEVEIHGLDASDSVPGLVRASALVRRLGLDLSISLSPANRNALLCLSSGSRMKVGYLRYANTLTPFLGNYPVEAFGLKLARQASYSQENLYRRAARIFEALDVEIDDQGLPPPVRLGDSSRSAPAPPGRPYVVLHPFSGWEPRSWPLQSFAELAEAIPRELDMDVTFVYAPGERSATGPLLERFDSTESVRFFSSADLLRVGGVIQGGAAFVGNDSGPLHLAAALGVPVIGLYGAAPPELTAPPEARGSMLYHRVECSPCDQRFCRMPERSCMSRIGVREVLEALEVVVNSCKTPADG